MPEYLNAAFQEKISTFHQLPSELFWQAWQRFDGYQRECPHHGYSDDELLAFFYIGVTKYYQYELDAAGFWDFCIDEDIQGAYRLVDNMAFSSRDNPMAKLDSRTYCLMEEANMREELISYDLEHPYYDQEYTPLPQNQIPTPPSSTSQTSLDDIKALFYNGFLEISKGINELKEEIAATSIALVSRLNALDTRIGIVEKQLDQEIEVTERQQGTLPMCTIVEDETEKTDSELAVTGAESAEEINLQPLPERAKDMSLAETEDISSMKNQTRYGFCAADIIENTGIPRTGPDIQGFNEFDQSQFLSFAGEGGCITYCDLIGSMTRPPEVLLNVHVLC